MIPPDRFRELISVLPQLLQGQDIKRMLRLRGGEDCLHAGLSGRIVEMRADDAGGHDLIGGQFGASRC